MKHSSRTPRTQPPRKARTLPAWLPWVILALAVGIFVWHASSSAFLQDDSFITYRYARNVIRGHGPVFNPGERTEGYTNFLWMMLLAGLGVIGLPFSIIIPLSQLIGVACGIGIMFIFFLLVRRHTTGPPGLAALATMLLAVNGSFAYWCVSGMETALFTLFLAASFYFYTRADASRRDLFTTSVLLGLSTLTRPEGTMFLGLFALHHFLRHMFPKRDFFTARRLKEFALLVGPFVVLAAPLYIWRLAYYGYLFPNTYYAKTGVSAAYIKTGIEYLVGFFKAYGLWGVAFVVPVALAIRKRKLRVGSPLFFTVFLLVIHALYVIWVGGDVLRNWRFFVPVMFLFYFLLTEGIWLLPLPRAVNTLILVALLPLTFIGPFTSPRTVRAEISRNLRLEDGLVSKMTATGRWFNRHLGEDEWFGCTTIGAVSWFADRNMVDMLGLTDAHIAHNPEHILESEWHWKERNYNTAHVLGLDPTYLYFSTGVKPSAEAERALFLRPRFRRGYFACPITVVEEVKGQEYRFTETIYKRKPGNDTIPLEPVAAPSGFINRYLDGINFLRVGADTAAALFTTCIKQAPPDFGSPYEWLGRIEQGRKRLDRAARYYQLALERDDWLITSHTSLAGIYNERGEFERAAGHLRKVVRYAPDYLDGYINFAAILVQLEGFDEADQVLTTACARFPMVPDLTLRLAWVQMQAGRYDEAEATLEPVLRRNPGDHNALGLLQQIRTQRAAADSGAGG